MSLYILMDLCSRIRIRSRQGRNWHKWRLWNN